LNLRWSARIVVYTAEKELVKVMESLAGGRNGFWP
jgi:hypothetical protein